jgi:hypothetical protein
VPTDDVKCGPVRHQVIRGSSVVIDAQTLGGGSGVLAGIGREVGLADIDWSAFTKELRTALAARAEQYVLIQVHGAEQR